MPPITSTLGFPRIGPRRELKAALERYWAGDSDATALVDGAAALKAANWTRQRSSGISHVPCGDFSLYDHVLDTSVMVGALPAGYGWHGGPVSLDTYFALARGTSGGSRDGDSSPSDGRPALEMTKWFDTNYHYVVPDFSPGQDFALTSIKVLDEYREAASRGVQTRPVLLGPVTYLMLGKIRDGSAAPLSLLPGLLPVYGEILRQLAAAGVEWVQIDEPCLVLDLEDRTREAIEVAYSGLANAAPQLKLLLATYFGALGDNLDTALRLPVAGLHIDLVRAPHQLDDVLSRRPDGLVVSLGVVDGRNVWRADLAKILDRIEPAADRLGTDRLMIAPSCSLLHVPIDLALETDLDPEIGRWLAFAVQKAEELAVLARALSEGRDAVADALASADNAVRSRRTSARIHDPSVRDRVAGVPPAMTRRTHSYEIRRRIQHATLPLPAFPTTTIGSFPQTEAVRKARARYLRGGMSTADYDGFLRTETESTIRWQEEIGLDVLVHGEFERNDMVQYFAERFAGFLVTKHGWVQSYGSRCVRPPIIFGDVRRPAPVTVGWSSYAQSLTQKPVKAMLTGPVTMLQWSFARDDLPRAAMALQIALAIRDEVTDLEAAGLRIIQIDEPALREGLPLRKDERQQYLDWAITSFRLAASGVSDATQIHTHMCYSEFNDIIETITELDADVISIETARSKMELLSAFVDFRYPNEIGPGVYDIHAPRCPTLDEMVALLREATVRLPSNRIWVNPDCGLKTRRWDEVRPALIRMVNAARQMRLYAAP